MEVIYLIALEITIILCVLKLFFSSFTILLCLIFIFGVFIFNNRKNIFLLLLPILFLIRVTFIFNNSIDIGDIKNFQISLYEGRGKIEKIDNRYPLTNSYLYLNGYPNGKYEITVNIKDITQKYGNNYYNINIEKLTSLSENTLTMYFQNRVESLLKNSSYDLKRVYEAIILGKNYRLTLEMREKFNYIGISHLMALSGFHISLIVTLVSALLPKKLPFKKRGRNILLLGVLTAYYLGIEHSPSLNRAYIMGSIYLLGKILDENTELFKTLIVSYTLSLIINPASIDTISFQLSYGAVFIIIGIFPYIKTKFYKGKSKVIDGLLLSLSIQIFLTPLIIYTFGRIQLLSFITNIVVVPVGSIFITLGFIALLLENFSLGFLILPFLNMVFKIFNLLVDLFYSFPFMSIEYKNESSLIPIFYFFIIGIVFIIKFRKDYMKDEKIYKRTKISQ